MTKRLVLALAITWLAVTHATAQTFRGLGIPAGSPGTHARDLSEDGATVVGFAGTDVGFPGSQALRWRDGLPPTFLGGLPNNPISAGFAVSSNGSIAAGEATGQPNTTIGFRWTGAPTNEALTGMRSVKGISGDGSTVVGYSAPPSSDFRAVRWTQAEGTVQLGVLGNPGPFGTGHPRIAIAANSNGTVIVGDAAIVTIITPAGPIHTPTPMIWDSVRGARTMPSAPGVYPRGGATDITPNGAIVAGLVEINEQALMFQWTEAGGYTLISPLTPFFANPVRISGDGTTMIAGINFWTAAGGTRLLTDVLIEAGCDFTGWTIQNAVGISFDGSTLAGNGINPMGQNEAWIATIPAPATVAALAVIGLSAVCRRRR